jgi:hypothetical protein
MRSNRIDNHIDNHHYNNLHDDNNVVYILNSDMHCSHHNHHKSMNFCHICDTNIFKTEAFNKMGENSLKRFLVKTTENNLFNK